MIPSKVPATSRQTPVYRSHFLHRRGSEGTDHRGAHLHPFRIGELFEDAFKPRLGFTDAIGILKNGFAMSEQTRYGKRHGDAMIAKARPTRTAQQSRFMDFKAVIHL